MSPVLIILGAGAPPEHIHAFGVQKVTLDRRVLDWQLDAFAALNPEVHFVGGYDIATVQQYFPNLTYHHNTHWRETGASASLAQALCELKEIRSRDIYVAYSDVLLRPILVAALAAASSTQCSIACDRVDAHSKRTPEMLGGKEFVGLVRIPASLSREVAADIIHRASTAPRQHLSALFDAAGCTMVDAQGQWAHAEFGRSVARFVLGSKASTLARLTSRLTQSRIPPLYYFTRSEYTRDAARVIAELCRRFAAEQQLVVRSSATDEDGFTRANAGRYHSELHVPVREAMLRVAIERVFASYGSDDAADEVLVQSQLADVVLSGVIFTRSLESAAPYYVLNYTHGSDTTAITSGAATKHIKTYIARCAPESTIQQLPMPVQALLRAVREIEHCVCHDALDIEFAIDSAGTVHTLQVRPLMIDDTHQDRSIDEDIAARLQQLHTGLQTRERDNPTIWSVMADWNPAEIIGRIPSPLAFDLYRHIITDRIWATQRQQVGYRDMRGTALIHDFAGHAFVDVRASLESFIPADVTDELSTALLDEALRQLAQHPEWHDKVEFELLPTCLDFDFARWQARYASLCDAAALEQWQQGLRAVTRSIIARVTADGRAAEQCESRCPQLEIPTEPFATWLQHTLQHCQDGALTFAHLARAGFVAAALLRTAVARGLMREERRVALMESIDGVGRMFTRAAAQVRDGTMARGDFIARFGHLRPGTYDIATPAYKHNAQQYLDPVIATATSTHGTLFAWTDEERRDLNAALQVLDIGIDADGLLAFVRDAVAGREYAKFVFTRLLSAALDQLAARGKALGIADDMLPAMALDRWLAADGLGDGLISETLQRYHAHRLAGAVLLPPVITDPGQVYLFDSPLTEPTFITTRSARAVLRVIHANRILERGEVEGAIVAILNADPGFDYLFALGISGLITAYGGPNSHMAIRACEYGIPAMIGIGEEAFQALHDGAMVEMNGQLRRWAMEEIACAS